MGHGPYSHAFEDWFELHPPSSGLHFSHEKMSLDLLRLIVSKYSISLSSDELELVCCMISSDYRKEREEYLLCRVPPMKNFMIHVVSNSISSIDCDKFDYLMRDSHYSGKPCGFDPHRIMSNCLVLKGGILCYQQKEAYNIYELFRTRYSMFRQVYSHRVSKAVECMVMDVLTMADPVLGIANSVADPRTFVRMTDDIVSIIMNSTDPRLEPAQALMNRILTRKLYKCVFETIWTGDAKKKPTRQEILDGILKYLNSPTPVSLAGTGVSCRSAPQSPAPASMSIPIVSTRDVQTNGLSSPGTAGRVNVPAVPVPPSPGDAVVDGRMIRVQILKLNYALGESNPVDNVLFYDHFYDDEAHAGAKNGHSSASEEEEDAEVHLPTPRKISREEVSAMLPR